MQHAQLRNRLAPKTREDSFEIAQPHSTPGRRPDQIKGVVENFPAKISQHPVVPQLVKVKTLERFSAEQKESAEEEEQE